MDKGFNLTMMASGLDLDRFQAPEDLPWLEQAQGDSLSFYRAVCRFHDSRWEGPAKSKAFSHYDLYHELITRHLQRQRPALIWYDPSGQWQKFSHGQLAKEAEQLAGQWEHLKVGPGSLVCIITPFGPDYLIAMLAGLYMGAQLSFIPPRGKTMVAKRLEVLDPDHLYIDPLYLGLLPEGETRVMPAKSKDRTDHPEKASHTYMTGDTVFKCFDPMDADLFTPKEVSVDSVYLSGVRDGLFALRLKDGGTVAAPGFNDLPAQPALVLSVLLNGGAFLHLPMKSIETDPDLLAVHPLAALGVTSRLRDMLMARPVRKARIWDAWFRDPAESSDMDIWDRFIGKLELEDIPAGAMLWNTGLGGCVLFSLRRKGQALQNVLSLPGTRWQLALASDETCEAAGGMGLFQVDKAPGEIEPAFSPTPCILVDTGMEKLFVGLNLPARKGICLPEKQIIALAQGQEGCRNAVLVRIPQAGKAGVEKFHLLIFTGMASRIDPAGLIRNICRSISTHIGEECLPDRVLLYPVFPRTLQGEGIDSAWCSAQYVSGGLNRKSNSGVFLAISRLRELVFNG